MSKYPVLVIFSIWLLLESSLALAYSVSRSNLLGGVKEVSVDSPEVKEIADAVMRKVRGQHKGERALILVEIEKATQQVVAGIKYNLHLKVGESACLKNKFNPGCLLDKERPYKACSSSVWDQPWMGKKKIDVHCSNYDD